MYNRNEFILSIKYQVILCWHLEICKKNDIIFVYKY